MNRKIDTSVLEGVRRVKARVTLEFEAYVAEGAYAPGPDFAPWITGNSDTARRVGSEVADAVIYHAPHLSETEEGDALISLVDGDRNSVLIHVDTEELGPADPANVTEDVARTEAWL